MKNLKLFTVILLSLLIIPFVFAERAGVIITFPDGSVHGECLEAESGTNGYNLLINQLSLSTSWSATNWGHSLCKINGIGNDLIGNSCFVNSGENWIFFNNKDNRWEPLPVGVDYGDSCWDGNTGDHYCINEGDVWGFGFINWGDNFQTKVYSFDSICNPIEISDLKVYVDGKKQKDADEAGGDIESKPGSKIKFKLELENNYLFKEELEIENLEAEVIIEDFENGKDFEKLISFKDLEIGDDDDDEFSFDVPLILEKDEYDVLLKITGTSEEGLKQEKTIEFILDIDRKKHNLLINSNLKSLESCIYDSNILDIEILNIGKKNEVVSMNIFNEALEIDLYDSFEMKKRESRYENSFSIDIPNISPGEYDINIRLEYEKTQNEEITLIVKDCRVSEAINNQNQKFQKLTVEKVNQIEIEKSFLNLYALQIVLGVFTFSLLTSIFLISGILRE